MMGANIHRLSHDLLLFLFWQPQRARERGCCLAAARPRSRLTVMIVVEKIANLTRGKLHEQRCRSGDIVMVENHSYAVKMNVSERVWEGVESVNKYFIMYDDDGREERREGDGIGELEKMKKKSKKQKKNTQLKYSDERSSLSLFGLR